VDTVQNNSNELFVKKVHCTKCLYIIVESIIESERVLLVIFYTSDLVFLSKLLSHPLQVHLQNIVILDLKVTYNSDRIQSVTYMTILYNIVFSLKFWRRKNNKRPSRRPLTPAAFYRFHNIILLISVGTYQLFLPSAFNTKAQGQKIKIKKTNRREFAILLLSRRAVDIDFR